MFSGKSKPAATDLPGSSRRAPVVDPELRILMDGEALLERAHDLGAHIDHRVHELVGQGTGDNRAIPGGQPASPAAILATKLLRRLFDGRQ
jgi:hypothetical protein